MKFFHVGFANPGLSKAFIAAGEYKFFDWTEWTAVPNNITNMRTALIKQVKDFNPDIVFLHIQAPGIIDQDTISQLSGFIINWTWDYRDVTPPWMVELAPYVHLTGFTNINDVNFLRGLGCNAELIQSGFDEDVFTGWGSVGEYPEIVFIGNNYPADEKFPLSDFRIEMVNALTERYGSRFGVYGFGWNNGLKNFMYREHKEAECYRSCKIAISLSHYNAPLYTSDRTLRIMASGAFCLLHAYPEMEKQFPDGTVVSWNDLKELFNSIDKYIVDDDSRKEIVGAGYRWVWANYRWRDMVDTLIKQKEIWQNLGNSTTQKSLNF